MAIQNNFPAISPSLSLDFANVGALDPRVTFSRASTATYYGTETAKAEENLFTFSQELDNAAWQQKIGVTVTANTGDTTAPDGTSTAELVTEDTNTSVHRVRSMNVSFTSGLAYTCSVFAKKGTRNFLQITFPAALGTTFANFDLDTGVLGTLGSGVTASIVNAGNGWYRCIATVTATSTTAVDISFGLITASNAARLESYTGTGATLYLWGAQLEQRSTATAYTPTTTQPITNYIPVLESAASGEARFDHNPNTFESLGLLIEESRTNLSIRSEEFDQWSNVGSQSAVFANTAIAPDGTLTADKVAPLSGTGTRGLGRGITGLTGTSVTSTIYAKAAERSLIQIRWFGGATGISSAYANFDLINGTTAGDATLGISMTPVGNGWWRCVASTAITGTLASQDHAIEFINSLSDGRRPSISDGNGFNGVYLWGAQLEAGAFPTSYTPTVASQVTRAADAASMTGANFSSWYSQGEGTLYAEAKADSTNAANGIASISNNTFGERISLRQLGGGTNNARILISKSGSDTASIFSPADSYPNGSFAKSGFGFAPGDVRLVVNGGTVSAPSAGSSQLLPTLVDRLLIGMAATGGAQLNGTIKKLAYYPKRLTNAELQGLTT